MFRALDELIRDENWNIDWTNVVLLIGAVGCVGSLIVALTPLT